MSEPELHPLPIDSWSSRESKHSVSGLWLGSSPNQLLFVMPGKVRGGIVSTVSFGFDSLATLLDAMHQLKAITAEDFELTFVSSRCNTFGTLASAVRGDSREYVVANMGHSKLLDAVMADMLRCIGGRRVRAAAQEFERANADPRDEVGNPHRLNAAERLTSAHKRFERRATSWHWAWYQGIDGGMWARIAIGKAALTAFAVAVIHQNLDLASAAKWIDKASDHFASYHSSTKSITENEIRHLEFSLQPSEHGYNQHVTTQNDKREHLSRLRADISRLESQSLQFERLRTRLT